MRNSLALNGREERRHELMQMWKDRRGQTTVLSLFHHALPKGAVPCAGMSVIDVILDREFVSDRSQNESIEKTA